MNLRDRHAWDGSEGIPLPSEVKALIEARQAVASFYHKRLHGHRPLPRLRFALDGNFVGDLGEALAAEHFGVQLAEARGSPRVDGFVEGGTVSVQIKATCSARGPVFRWSAKSTADRLLFFDVNLTDAVAYVAFNGPESVVREYLKKEFAGQRSLSPQQIREADRQVLPDQRLRRR